MPFCANCGTQLPANAKFCSNCGSAVEAAPAPAPAPVASSPKKSPAKTGQLICGYCARPIMSGVKYVVAFGSNFHEGCLVAHKPGCKPDSFPSYIVDDDNPALHPICAGCGQPIKSGKIISSGTNKWHDGCLRCKKCQQPIMANTPLMYDGTGGYIHSHCR